MNIYLELLLVAIVVTYIVDLSGWTDSWLGWLSAFTKRQGYGPVRELKPFSCGQCMTWWSCLAWAVIRGAFTLPVVAACAGYAFMSLTLCQLCLSIRERLLRWIAKL